MSAEVAREPHSGLHAYHRERKQTIALQTEPLGADEIEMPEAIERSGGTVKRSMEPVELKVKVASRTGTRTRTATERVWGAEICSDCGAVSGSLEVELLDERRLYEQRCHCWRHLPPQERWAGYDFNKHLELCYCCGIEPIRSGSRWSVFFCGECAGRVMEFNRRHGHWVMPIGRHSTMHGVSLGESDPVDPFVAKFRGLSDAIDHLDEWACLNVRRNVLRLMVELRTWDDLALAFDLSSYLSGVGELGLEKRVAFEGLRDHFAVEE